MSAGDLAVIIKSDIPGNIGAIVKVERFLGVMSYLSGEYPTWQVSIPEGQLFHGFDSENNIIPTSFGFASCPDMALWPINKNQHHIDHPIEATA